MVVDNCVHIKDTKIMQLKYLTQDFVSKMILQGNKKLGQLIDLYTLDSSRFIVIFSQKHLYVNNFIIMHSVFIILFILYNLFHNSQLMK